MTSVAAIDVEHFDECLVANIALKGYFLLFIFTANDHSEVYCFMDGRTASR
ncbi:MAG: hypothetical protein KAV87_01715 [Desulfobacteraceae bacterium]|nr:hypothetical protein [Desulfobacteraceae bacterium]